ncbi:MAG: 30S ribosomal protein S1 [Alphaproteobacteria bacterium]|nr:MAG: 30S ribosomal protein S1 [Alphaproteobacteria bacterium]
MEQILTELSTEEKPKSKTETFSDLFEKSFEKIKNLEGSVVEGTVISVEKEAIIVDIGLKSEGRILKREFGNEEKTESIKIGDIVEVYIERLEDSNGNTILSREKARREEAWVELEKFHKEEKIVTGVILGRVKGGFTVDIDGATAFLPGSQVDIKPIKDFYSIMNIPQNFQILKMDKKRGNIVISRRAVLEENRAEARSEIVSNIQEGQTLDGIVKNITDYGAFVDLGGVDGLLHVTDISWRRINHPSEALKLGDNVKVKVIKFNDETKRISLGIKQLNEDPWQNIHERFPIGSKISGVVTNITDYGSFVELEDGIEGLVHVSEMSWTKKNVHPNHLLSSSEKIEVMVLEIEEEKRRISLGIKQCVENPWEVFNKEFKINQEIEGEIKNVTDFGIFVGLKGEIDGLVHLSDISWDGNGDELIKSFKQGTILKTKILDINVENEKVSLGIKQLSEDKFSSELENIKLGDTVTCLINKISDNNIEVSIGDNIKGNIKKSDLSRDRKDQKTDRFGVGDKVDATVIKIDKKQRSVNVSIKAREIEEEKQAMAEFGSSDSGASLGDILGAALEKKNQNENK